MTYYILKQLEPFKFQVRSQSFLKSKFYLGLFSYFPVHKSLSVLFFVLHALSLCISLGQCPITKDNKIIPE